MKEMKIYKKIGILFIPILFWIFFALLEYLAFGVEILDFLENLTSLILLTRYLSCIFIFPITYAILTWNLAKNIKESILFYIISYAAQIFGFFIEGFSYFHFISGDSATYIITYGSTGLLAIILGIAYLLAIIFYILIKLVDKIPER